MNITVFLLNFDGIYQTQNFYIGEKYRWIYKNHMAGISGYCDPSAKVRLRNRLKNISQPALTFLGSGNYHYISSFLLEKIKNDFTLVLFDHHSDVQRPAFGNLISCGNWLRQADKQLAHLKQIVWVGVEQLEWGDFFTPDEVTVFSGGEIAGGTSWYGKLEKAIHYPVYLSVDKDVFNRKASWTNWDQGVMRIDQFSRAFRAISESHRMFGMDICGEFPAIYGDSSLFEAANRKNNQANSVLLNLWKNYALPEPSKIFA